MMYEILKDSALFQGLSEGERETALRALSVTERNYQKGKRIFSAGDIVDRMGLVISGSVTIESSDLWGNRTILSHIAPGQFFAETYALLKDEPMLVDVCVNEESRILFLRLDTLQTAEHWTVKITRNLLTISVRKNLALSLRSFHTAPKTIRERVTAYLNTEALRQRSRTFRIPYDRQQLANYLNLDRTALSKELGRMRNDGLIEFRKDHFVLK